MTYSANDRWLLRSKYGLSTEDYEALLVAQDGKCAICRDECETGRRLCVDHDHETGRVRGLLCVRCNALIGYARDDVRTLAAAAIYLRDTKSAPFADEAMPIFASAARAQGVHLERYLREAGIVSRRYPG